MFDSYLGLNNIQKLDLLYKMVKCPLKTKNANHPSFQQMLYVPFVCITALMNSGFLPKDVIHTFAH